MKNIESPKEAFGNITMIQGDCAIEMEQILSESVDVILTDPPYLYLKNHKLDIPFDEQKVFTEYKRILKKDGFVILFGRGTSFYRWNTMLADLGFKFKEEIVWDKGCCTSPLMPMSRIHETVSIHTKGKGKINRVKIPYLEMKANDIPGICQDVKRLGAALGNPKSLKAVKMFLEENVLLSDGTRQNSSITVSSKINGIDRSVSSKINGIDRSVSVMQAMKNGMQEKTIIRKDAEHSDRETKHSVSCGKDIKSGDRSTNVLQSMTFGMNEKSVIREVRDHYSAIHPTQKPVRLLERLIQLVTEPFSPDVTVLDSFAGSMSTGEACYNLGLSCILIEKDKEYYQSGRERIGGCQSQGKLF